MLIIFVTVVIINLMNLKITKEGELLRRVLISTGKVLEKPLRALGSSQDDPFEMINEHIKLQKSGDPLYPFNDSSLK